MGYGMRGLPSPTGPMAEGDKDFKEFLYNDAIANLGVGMPLYKDLTDAAEFNTTSEGSVSTAFTPASIATAGKVVLGTNANAGPYVGIFQPVQGETIPASNAVGAFPYIARVLVEGVGLVSVIAGQAVTVGSALTAPAPTVSTVGCSVVTNSQLQTACGSYVGRVLATSTFVTTSATVVTTLTGSLVNAYVTRR